jgi:hypothetical protein
MWSRTLQVNLNRATKGRTTLIIWYNGMELFVLGSVLCLWANTMTVSAAELRLARFLVAAKLAG